MPEYIQSDDRASSTKYSEQSDEIRSLSKQECLVNKEQLDNLKSLSKRVSAYEHSVSKCKKKRRRSLSMSPERSPRMKRPGGAGDLSPVLKKRQGEEEISFEEELTSKEANSTYFNWLEYKEDALMRLYSAPGVLKTIRGAKTTKAAVYKRFARLLTSELNELVTPKKVADKITVWARKYEQIRVVLKATGKGEDEKQRAKKSFRLFDQLERIYGDSLADNPHFLLQSPVDGGKHINVGCKTAAPPKSSNQKSRTKRLDDTFNLLTNSVTEQGEAVKKLMLNSERKFDQMIGAITSMTEVMKSRQQERQPTNSFYPPGHPPAPYTPFYSQQTGNF